MKLPYYQTAIINITTAVLIFLFLYTGFDKLRHQQAFIYALRQIPFMQKYAGFLAGFIPGIEVGIATILIFPVTRRLGLMLATGLMLLFTLYLVGILVVMKDLPCSCGGIIQELSWPQHLVLNILLTTLGYLAARYIQKLIAINRESRIPV